MTFSQKRTILIVDDEDLIRELLADALSDDFKVLAARNGEEALTLFEQHRDEIELVITDLIMPQMRGDELAERVRELRPTLPIIFISGYEREIETDALLAKGRAAFLPKPFDVLTLTSTLREVLV
jgi:two-component system cell cycle sensor histidine kinase/response regulator CckA